MKAEREDMPEYLRKKKKGPWRALAIIGVGTAITAGVIIALGKPIVIDVAKLKESIRVNGKPLFEAQEDEYSVRAEKFLTDTEEEKLKQRMLIDEYRQEQYRKEIDRQMEEQARLEQQKRQAAEQSKEKQTVFNDRNYVPRGADNVNQFSQQRPQQEKESVVRVTVVKEETRLRDYCDNAARIGSIEHRECKKRADLAERNRSYSGNRTP